MKNNHTPDFSNIIFCQYSLNSTAFFVAFAVKKLPLFSLTADKRQEYNISYYCEVNCLLFGGQYPDFSHPLFLRAVFSADFLPQGIFRVRRPASCSQQTQCLPSPGCRHSAALR